MKTQVKIQWGIAARGIPSTKCTFKDTVDMTYMTVFDIHTQLGHIVHLRNAFQHSLQNPVSLINEPLTDLLARDLRERRARVGLAASCGFDGKRRGE